MLLELYHGIFRALVHLIPEEYSKPCQISKMMRPIENPGIVRTVDSGIFRHILGHSTIFSHAQAN